MLIKQQAIADETRDFLNHWGLKAKYVAEQVSIDKQTFSKFVNHRIALSGNQLLSLRQYMNDYECRNRQ